MATFIETYSTPKKSLEEGLHFFWQSLASYGFLSFAAENKSFFYGDYSDPYSGPQPYASESSTYRLENKTTGGTLELIIRLELFRNSRSPMTFSVSGEESEVEIFKRAYQQMLFLEEEKRKEKDLVRLNVWIKLGVQDPNPNRKRVRWQNKYRKEYLFQPPSEWFVDKELDQEKLSVFLDFIKKNELKLSSLQLDHACEIVKVNLNYESSLDLYGNKLERFFTVDGSGEIKKFFTPR